ncbi:MAG TPA: DMT family transporter [Longimicrobium sp.]
MAQPPPAANKKERVNWVAYSFVAMLGFAAMQLIFKRLTQLEPKTEVINFYFFLFSTVGFLVLLAVRKTRLLPRPESVPLFVAIALIAVVANYCVVSAIRSAPNPGYVTGIRAFETVIIVFAAMLIFQSELTPIKLAGIALSVCGLVLLSI